MDPQQNKTVVNQFIEQILNRGDLSQLGYIIHSEFKFHGMPDTETLEDLKLAFAYLHVNWTHIYREVEFEIEEMQVEDDIVTVNLTRRGVLKHQYTEAGTTDEMCTVSVQETYRVVDGKIKERWIKHRDRKRLGTPVTGDAVSDSPSTAFRN